MPMLLVIDMQPLFKASSRPWMLRNVSREIRAARAAGWGVMFLEYTRERGASGVPVMDRTHDRLTRLVADYPHAVVVHKEDDDGSGEVLRAAAGWRGGGEEHIRGGIRVAGVNTEACVADTVNGLSEAIPSTPITVVGDACNGRRSPDAPNRAGQDRIRAARNVRIEAGRVRQVAGR